MKSFDKNDFDKHFDALEIKKGDNLILHSQLLSFGKCMPETIFLSLIGKISEKGTLVVPTYVFGSESPYDQSSVEPTQMGSLSNFVLGLEESIRSRTPVHNHAAFGALAEDFRFTKNSSSFGADTDFDLFCRKDYELVLLGCPLSKGATFLHHIEALAEVPYRRWVSSPKTILNRNRTYEISFNYFERYDTSYIEDFDKLTEVLGDKLLQAKAPYGMSYKIKIRDLKDITMKLIEDDPYYLVKRIDE